MWKKSEPEEVEREAPKPAATIPQERAESRRSNTRATVGPSISVHGDITGEEDLLVQGRVEGKIELKQNSVTVGPSGQIKADVCGKVIIVEGEVDGSLFGGEQIILRQSARVRGNIVAPRVTLEDGAIFKGNIDMEVKAPARAAAASIPAASSGSVGPKLASVAPEAWSEESKKAVKVG